MSAMILMRATIAKRSRAGSSMNGTNSPSMRRRTRTSRGLSAVSMWMSDARRAIASLITELISRTSVLSASETTSASRASVTSGATFSAAARLLTLSAGTSLPLVPEVACAAS